MLIKLISFLAAKFGVSALVVELCMASVCFGGAFWWLKHHDAVLYDKAHKVGVEDGIKQMEVKKKKEWDEIDKMILAEKDKNEIEKARIEIEKVELAKKKAESLQKREIIKYVTETKIKEIPAEVAKIPPDRLATEIYNKSNELANIEEKITEDKIIEFDIPHEQRILGQLDELLIRRIEVNGYETWIAEHLVDDTKEQEVNKKEIQNLNNSITTLTKERDVALDKAKFYENSYKIVTKKRSKMCWLWKFLTFGTKKCS